VAKSPWRNRIVGYSEEEPDQLLANPSNWRIHPAAQQNALSGVLKEVGLVQNVVANRTTGHLVDGHLRVMLAMRENQPVVPVTWVELSEEEEHLILAALDPLAAMATADAGALDALLSSVQSGEAAVQAMLAELAESAGLYAPKDEDGNTAILPDVIYSQDEIIEAAFTWFRANGFPYRNLAPHVSMQQINKLLQTEPENLINTDMAYHVADTYHPHRFHAAADSMKTPYDAFMDDDLLRRAMRLNQENRYTLPQEAFGQMWIVSGVQAASNFRPGFASFLYRKYCPPNATVLDASTGYGGRLVGFIASGINGFYIGIDPNTETHAGNLRMAQELGFSDRIELHNLPAEDVSHDVVAGRCDFAFTSPPYFRKEHYSDEDTQSWVRYQTGDAWRDGFLAPMMALQHAALKPGCRSLVNIADVKIGSKTYPLVEWTRQAAARAGLAYERTLEFPLTRRFGAGMADEVATEPVLVFSKPL
jgi:hypothetical protein